MWAMLKKRKRFSRAWFRSTDLGVYGPSTLPLRHSAIYGKLYSVSTSQYNVKSQYHHINLSKKIWHL